MHDSLALIIKQQEALMQEAKERKVRDDELEEKREKVLAEGGGLNKGYNVAVEGEKPRSTQRGGESSQLADGASAAPTPPSHNFNLNSPSGSFTVTTIAGDKTDTNNTTTTTNSNSGNTTNTTITGSYNDSSYRNYGGKIIFCFLPNIYEWYIGPGRAKRGRGR